MPDTDFTPRPDIPFIYKPGSGPIPKARSGFLGRVLGALLLVGGVASGITLVQNQQLLEPKASVSGSNQNIQQTSKNTPVSQNSSGNSAMCQKIEIYSPSWTSITAETFRSLTKGSKVYFCVKGSTDSTTPFDKARFTINNIVRPETTTKRPGTGDFCDLFTIPINIYEFAVSGELHHPKLGWH